MSGEIAEVYCSSKQTHKSDKPAKFIWQKIKKNWQRGLKLA